MTYFVLLFVCLLVVGSLLKKNSLNINCLYVNLGKIVNLGDGGGVVKIDNGVTGSSVPLRLLSFLL
jgi:hypothetical protein